MRLDSIAAAPPAAGTGVTVEDLPGVGRTAWSAGTRRTRPGPVCPAPWCDRAASPLGPVLPVSGLGVVALRVAGAFQPEAGPHRRPDWQSPTAGLLPLTGPGPLTEWLLPVL